MRRFRASNAPSVDLVLRISFNTNQHSAGFGSMMEIINNVTMLSIFPTDAARHGYANASATRWSTCW